MPGRNPELPEGTDHIINGAMETGAGTGASTGSSDGSGDGSGFVGSGGDDTGGTSLGAGTTVTYAGGTAGGGVETGGGLPASGGGGGGSASGGGSSGAGGGFDGGAPIKQQLRDGVDTARQQAGDKIRTYALTGKDRATTALDDLSQVVSDAAAQIDDRLGAQYGDYARRAADAVTDFADTLRNKEVDELFDDARKIVRKSPGIAIGAAAIVGFTLVRLVKAGLDNDGAGAGNVDFKPDGGRNIDFKPEGGSGGSGSGTGA